MSTTVDRIEVGRLGVDRLARLEHRDELGQAPRAGGRQLGVVQTVEDRIAVLARELLEELPRLRAGIELALEVGGHAHAPLALICGVPAAVRPGPLHLGETRWAHPALADQALGRLAVDPRPSAALA